ncbi:hypothetical protein CEXT_495001 [Caerostris extrusa]|uniref:Uncharacterized protein n=1 Tax=Caerostris extrusa TaxID=172846 RepID=A0AAV4MAN9_CAEEX|nr:hypothetical protein CEXT_495001 [Caerostris extrusa]
MQIKYLSYWTATIPLSRQEKQMHSRLQAATVTFEDCQGLGRRDVCSREPIHPSASVGRHKVLFCQFIAVTILKYQDILKAFISASIIIRAIIASCLHTWRLLRRLSST